MDENKYAYKSYKSIHTIYYLTTLSEDKLIRHIHVSSA